ncbi:MAG: hypothetical protein WCG95_07225 [bacterium]
MPVIPTVNNNKNNSPQRKQAFGATLTPKSAEFIEKKFGAVGSFLLKLSTAGIRSKANSHPLIEIIDIHQNPFNDGTAYLVQATHPKTSISKSTSAFESLDDLIKTIQKVSNDLVDALNRMGM